MRALLVACLLPLGWSLTITPGIPDEPRVPPPPGLVVVTPAAFAPALKDYLAHKAKQLPTRCVHLEAVLKEASGGDDAGKLKRWLYDQWRQQHVRYVLLVGDAAVMPVRYMVLDRATPAAFDYAFYPSDLYYADVAADDGSFDDWNGNKDDFHAHYYGEVRGEKNKSDPINFDKISYVPELAVGRWPVATAREAGLVAAKTVSYERELTAGKKPGAERAAFFAIDGWVDSRGVLDAAAKALGPKWQVERRFYGRTPAPSEAELYRLLNEGMGLVVHAGHGETDRWEHAASLAGFRSKVKNEDRLPILLSAGCSTAYFAPLPPYEAYVDAAGQQHRGTNAGEVFTAPPPPPAVYQKQRHHVGLGVKLLSGGPGGAVAYFGCNTGSQPCGLTLVSGFVSGLGRTDAAPRLGDAWRHAVDHYWKAERLAALTPTDSWYPPSIFFQGMKFMLFGDPTLLIPGAQP